MAVLRMRVNASDRNGLVSTHGTLYASVCRHVCLQAPSTIVELKRSGRKALGISDSEIAESMRSGGRGVA